MLGRSNSAIATLVERSSHFAVRPPGIVVAGEIGWTLIKRSCGTLRWQWLRTALLRRGTSEKPSAPE